MSFFQVGEFRVSYCASFSTWLEHQFPALEAEKLAYIDIMIRFNLRLDYDMATKTIMRT